MVHNAVLMAMLVACMARLKLARSKLICIDVRDCTAIGPKAVDMLNMLLPNCNVLYLQGKNFTGH